MEGIVRISKRIRLISKFVCIVLLIVLNTTTSNLIPQARSKPLETNELLSPSELSNENLKMLGEWDINTNDMNTISFRDNLAYIACFSGGIQILNVSNPLDPQLILSYETGSNVFEIISKDDLLYLATSNGLSILDISNFTTIQVIGSYHTSQIPFCIDIAGSIALLGCIDQVLFIDITNPFAPYLLSSFSITEGSLRVFQASDNYLYYCTTNNGLSILNITDPNDPIHIIDFSSGINIQDLAINGTIGYLAATDAGLLCINLTKITAPEIIFTYNYYLGDYTTDVYLEGSSVYFYDNGLHRLDVNNLSSPKILGSYYIYTPISDFCVSQSIIYLTVQNLGLYIVNFANPELPELLFVMYSQGVARHLWINDDIAVIANGETGLFILNISNPNNPIQISQVSYFALNPYRVIGSEKALYVLSNDDLFVISISDITQPFIVGSIQLEAVGGDLLLNGDYLFVTVYSSGCVIFDITNPLEPIQLPTLAGGYTLTGVAIRGNYVFVTTTRSGILVYNLQDPYYYLEYSYSFGSEFDDYRDICVTDTRAIAVTSTRLIIFDITSLKNVNTMLSTTYDDYLEGLSLQGDWLYFVGYFTGLLVLNLHNLSLPLRIASYYGGNNEGYALAKNDIIYYSNGFAGLEILQIDMEDSDSDLLPDILENEYYHTDPLNNDTDGDLIFDGLESYKGSNPLDPNDPNNNAYFVIGNTLDIYLILHFVGLVTIVFIHRKPTKKSKVK